MGKCWWILGYEEPLGPYNTRAEANEDRLGLIRTERFKDEPGFVTTDPPKGRV